jgi:proteasome lid subunit RPN8/RPN11
MKPKSNPLQQLLIPFSLWHSLIKGLRRKSQGIRESGAFLLGKIGGNKVKLFVFYDNLDPECLDSCIISFDGAGFVPLWKMCEKKQLQVLADVHTHLGKVAIQSEIDKKTQ